MLFPNLTLRLIHFRVLCALSGSMYTFVFMWTPQLEETNITGAKLPYGTVFACFMVSCMIGSTCVGILGRWKPAREYMVYVFLLAGLSLFPAAVPPPP